MARVVCDQSAPQCHCVSGDENIELSDRGPFFCQEASDLRVENGPARIDMHVHACYSLTMRTTVEISDAHRAKLLEIAARRGEKGFSRLVEEALDQYLADESSRKGRVEAAIALGGSFSDKAADALEESVRRIRGTWR